MKEETKVSGNFTVTLRKNESQETLIRRFLKKQKKDRLIEELLDRKTYKKPTTKKREALFRKQNVLRKLKEKQILELKNEEN